MLTKPESKDAFVSSEEDESVLGRSTYASFRLCMQNGFSPLKKEV